MLCKGLAATNLGVFSLIISTRLTTSNNSKEDLWILNKLRQSYIFILCFHNGCNIFSVCSLVYLDGFSPKGVC